MALAVPAYPEMARSDYERIQEFRKEHDLYYQVIEPHFTLAFPLWIPMESQIFVEEIEKQTQGFPPFDFCLRCATLNKDAFNDLYHVFLVPDEGYSKVVKLYDRLCSGWLFQFRLLDIDYIPHIGIGNSTDAGQCLEMIHRWNQTEFAIPGRVTALDVVIYENQTVRTIQRIALGG